MLDFLWHLRRSIPLEGTVTNEAALERVERLLERQRKPITGRDATHVVFDAPLWRDISRNWQAMTIYDHGRFWIEQGLGGRSLRYDLRSLHGFLYCLFAALAAFLFLCANGAPLLLGLKVAPLAFAWLYGANLLLAIMRVPRLVRRALRAA